MKILTLLLLLSSLISVEAMVIRNSNIDIARKHRNRGQWRAQYMSRATSALGVNARVFFSEIANSKKSLSYVESRLNSIFTNKKSEVSARNSDINKYITPLISIDKKQYGLSQLVLESALACGLFPSSDNFKANVCRGWPKMATALMKIIRNQLPRRGKRYTNWASFIATSGQSNYVDHGRGLVLVRALTPLFNAYYINNSTIQKYFSTYNTEFRKRFLALAGEVNNGLKDFYLHIIVTNYGRDSRNFSDTFNRYNPTNALQLCLNKRKDLSNGNRRSLGAPRCTSNHAMVGYLGRLMMNVMSDGNLNISATEFEKLIENGIYYKKGKHYFTDNYRTQSLKSDVREKKGYSYAMLQARTLTVAAEILLNKGTTNLYSHNSNRLKKGLDFLAQIGTYKKGNQTNHIYFGDSDFSARNSNFNDRFLFINEYYSYVATGTSWARNYGFFMMPYKRFCGSSSEQSKYPNLCRQASNFNGRAHTRNVIPFRTNNYDIIRESVNVGPTQILFIRQ